MTRAPSGRLLKSVGDAEQPVVFIAAAGESGGLRGALARSIQRVIHARMRSNLMSGLGDITSPDVAEEIVLGVTALIDGLWLRLGLQPGSVTREQAVRQVKDYVAGRLAMRQSPVELASAG